MNEVNNTPRSTVLSNVLFNTLFCLMILKLFISYSTHMGIHENANKVIDFFILLVTIFSIYKLKNKLIIANIRLLIVVSIFMIYILFINSIYGVTFSSFTYYSRLYIPMLVYIAFTCCIDKVNLNTFHKKMFGLIIFATLLSIVGLYFMPENFNHGEFKLPTYFSGLHKSSYIFCFLLIATFICSKFVPLLYKIPLFISALYMFYMIVEGWGIRTPFLAVIFFFYCYFTNRLTKSIRLTLNYTLIMLFILMIFSFGSDIDWNKVSSGRLLMWETKVYMFVSSSPFEALLGKGYGSDYIEVGDWWGEKDSHNNYLQTLTELGVFGVCFLILTIYLLFKAQPSKTSMLLVLSYAITGMFSNGVIYRVLPSYIFILILIYFQTISYQNHNTKRVSNG